MTRMSHVELEPLMAARTSSVNPLLHPHESFDLYSIPAFDRGEPDVLQGSGIGSTKQVVEPGDVLLSKIVPHIRRAWIVGAQRGRRLIASSEWIVFRSDRVHPQYLRHALTCDDFHRRFMSTVSGVGGSLLRARPSQVAQLTIPLPCFEDPKRSLAEQKRIAAILDKADAIRRRRQNGHKLTAELIHALFHSAFGNLDAESERYPIHFIGACAEVQGGLALSPRRSAYPVKLPYLRVANVFRDRLDLSEIKSVRMTEDERVNTLLQSGDVLIVEGHGNPEEIGRCAVWKGEIGECSHQNHLIRVRTNRSKLLPEYLNAYLNSRRGRQHLLRQGKTTSGLNTISLSNVRQTPVPVPPLDLQKQFTRELSAAKTVISRRLETEDAVCFLFDSLVQRAFRGEL